MTSETAVRPEWTDLPVAVRSRIEDRLGASVVTAHSQRGGFTHGLAVRAHLTNGRRVFVKALDATDPLAGAFRTEAAVAAALPAATPSPAVLWHGEPDGWIVTVFTDIDGRHPRLDHPAELAAVLDTTAHLGRILDPCPVTDVPTVTESLVPDLRRWSQYRHSGPPADLNPWAATHLDRLADAESHWTAHATGTALVHTDLRPDNMLRTPDGTIVVVDWATPCLGPPWIDVVALVPSLLAAGVDPEPILTTHTGVPRPTALSFLVALAGYWEHNARQPPPPRSPNLRPYQAETTRRLQKWLRTTTW